MKAKSLKTAVKLCYNRLLGITLKGPLYPKSVISKLCYGGIYRY